ncbi:hypothetical protein CLIB1444_02S14972 [[Candida] jaroonii]|uniref:Uncharacterized protein n=1 Tax=[Candida] jaroonii TaxID=467808 RepID=A0ACA9Y426_9ASCO|nr:hypothetical protein CLIB1444_02S14972 [[Candida] jaroonii]
MKSTIVLLLLLPMFSSETITEIDLSTTLATITSCEGGCERTSTPPSNVTSFEGAADNYKPIGVAAGVALIGLIM